jgi:hypothetical protein
MCLFSHTEKNTEMGRERLAQATDASPPPLQWRGVRRAKAPFCQTGGVAAVRCARRGYQSIVAADTGSFYGTVYVRRTVRGLRI